MKTTVHFLLCGKVQAVGMRVHAMRCAARLGVTGRVWNRQDGMVEGFAQHESAEVLDEFKHQLQSGPGKVDSAEFTVDDSAEPVDGFDIVNRG